MVDFKLPIFHHNLKNEWRILFRTWESRSLRNWHGQTVACHRNTDEPWGEAWRQRGFLPTKSSTFISVLVTNLVFLTYPLCTFLLSPFHLLRLFLPPHLYSSLPSENAPTSIFLLLQASSLFFSFLRHKINSRGRDRDDSFWLKGRVLMLITSHSHSSQ